VGLPGSFNSAIPDIEKAVRPLDKAVSIQERMWVNGAILLEERG